MILLSCAVWVLLIGLFGSVVYGFFSYVQQKFWHDVLVTDADGPGLREALLEIYRAREPSEIKEMEVKALFSYPKYRSVIKSAVEEKKNPEFSNALQNRFYQVRRWWLAAFFLYYAIMTVVFLPVVVEAGFHNIPALGRTLSMLLGNIISGVIVYHCAFRKSGSRLLLSILFFLPLYVLGISIMVTEGSPLFQHLTLEWASIKKFVVEICGPMLLVFSPIIFYWVTSLYLWRINREVAQYQKLESVQLILRISHGLSDNP